MSTADLSAKGPSWHPSLDLLELIELVAQGLLPAIPGSMVPQLPQVGPAGVVVEDAESTPVAKLSPDGAIHKQRPFAHPPLRSARRTPEQVQAWSHAAVQAGLRPVAVVVDHALAPEQVEVVRAAVAAGAAVCWLVLVGSGRGRPPRGLPVTATFRATQELALALTPTDAHLVPHDIRNLVVPLALPAGHDAALPDVVHAYGLTQLPLSSSHSRPHVIYRHEHRRVVPPVSNQGVVVFFTGLSGSGKSTVAQAFAELIELEGTRRLTLLDGDVVRRWLTPELGFSAADRATNVRRIGYVAAEISRHGGLVVCAPIAPQAAIRDDVRQQVTTSGGAFVLVYVATPLAECERRDRKGLYAAARRGEIADFTGISAPYEVPTDAHLTLDTTHTSPQECAALVWRLLADQGYVPPQRSAGLGGGGGMLPGVSDADSRLGVAPSAQANPGSYSSADAER